jgi:hypothetical protein
VTLPLPATTTVRRKGFPVAVTTVDAVAVLFDDVGSSSVPVTVAVFVRVFLTCGVTVIVIVAVPPLASVPRVHVTLLVQLPCVVVTEANVTLLGSVSLTVPPSRVKAHGCAP